MTGRHRPKAPKPVDAFDEDTGNLETLKDSTAMIAHDVPGYGAHGRQPSPARRTGHVPAAQLPEHRAKRAPTDWPAVFARLGMLLVSCGILASWVALFRARSADELLHAAGAVSVGWIVLAGIIGWGLNRG